MLDSGKRLTAYQKKVLDELIKHRGDDDILRTELIKFSLELYEGKRSVYTWIRKWGYENRTGRGKYSLKKLVEISQKDDVSTNAETEEKNETGVNHA